MDGRWLINRLHGKAAELCLANSGNSRVTARNTLSTLIVFTAHIHVHGMRYSFYRMLLVKFYCDVIARSRLQLINTSIVTFSGSKNLYVNQMRLYITCEKSGGMCLAEPGLTAGRLACRLAGKIWARHKLAVNRNICISALFSQGTALFQQR